MKVEHKCLYKSEDLSGEVHRMHMLTREIASKTVNVSTFSHIQWNLMNETKYLTIITASETGLTVDGTVFGICGFYGDSNHFIHLCCISCEWRS